MKNLGDIPEHLKGKGVPELDAAWISITLSVFSSVTFNTRIIQMPANGTNQSYDIHVHVSQMILKV